MCQLISLVSATAGRRHLEKQLSTALPVLRSSRWEVFLIYTEKQNWRVIKIFMLRKELSLSQYSSLQNNPLIQAVEFVFCAFAFYCRYLGHALFICRGVREELNCCQLPPHTSTQPSFEGFICTVSFTGILFYACVGCCCLSLIILTRVCMWSMDLCNSIPQPWVHLEHMGPLIPVGS